MKPAANGIYLGFDDDGEILSYKGDRHIAWVGANGTGKSNRLAVANLLRSFGRSWVVVDVKPELGPLTANARRRFGDVVILDPFNAGGAGSAGFNPLLSLDPSSPSFNADAGLVAEALITVDGGGDAHWSESAQVLLAWLIMHEVVLARRDGATPWLGNVRAVLGEKATAATDANEEGSGIVKEAFEACRSNIEAIGNKAGQYTEWSKEISSILSVARRKTVFLDDVELSRDLSGSFDFSEIKRQPQTVYLTLPADKLSRHKGWLRLALSAAVRVCLDDPKNLGVPVVLLIDEFAALGHLPIIETVWALVRGYGLQIIPVLQDLGQLKKLYGDRWESFIGNTGAACFFTPGDSLTAEWMSKRIGEHLALFPAYSVSETPQGEPSFNVNYSYQRLPEFSAFELYGMPSGSAWVVLAGLSQVVQAFAPWWSEVPQWRAAATV